MSRPVLLRSVSSAPAVSATASRLPTGGAALAFAAFACVAPGLAHAADAEAEAAEQQRNQIVVDGHRTADANPNANEKAPYKVEKSANGKFTEPLRDTPKSITAIPKEVIEDIGATSFREVVRSTPGVTLGTGEGGNAFGDRIFIRGFEARNDVYIDGLRDPGVTSREIFAVEQIEIVKGPSGSFGGRGTTGGLVSLQSKRSSFIDNYVIAEGGVGTEEFWRGTVDANYRLSDSVAVRVNGLYHSADTPGRDYVETERYGVTAAITAHLTDTLSVGADYYFFRLDGMPDFGHPFDVRTQRPFAVDRDNFYGVVARDFQKNGADVASLRIEYEPSEALRFRSTTRYGETFNRYIVSAPENPVITDPDPSLWNITANPKNSNRRNRYYANVTDMTAELSTGGVEHMLVFGGEFANERVSQKPYSITSTSTGTPTNPIYTSRFGVVQNLFNPDPNVAFPFTATEGLENYVKIQSLAAYLIDTIKLSPQWSVTLGARYDTYDLKQFNPDINATLPGLQPQSLCSSTDFMNWQASLLYKPVEALSLYASFATSSNPSGEQIDGNGASYDGIAPQTVNLDPERNEAWEAGAKYELFNGELLLTAAAFQITKKNAREQVTPGVFDTVGKLRSRGLELSVSGTVAQRVQLFGGYTLIDAKIVDSSNPLNEGRRFANIPKHSAQLLADVLVTDRLEIGGQVYAQSRIYGGSTAAGSAYVPGYVRFDAVAKFRPTDNTELRLNVLNLTNKRYYDAIYRSATPFAYIAPGRSATLTAKVTF